jgi:serine/threonine-protein kinase ATR
MAIAKHHKRTPYVLISPYMHEVAPLVVTRMCTHPSLLTETCNFLSMTPVDLISVTLSRTLPQLFAHAQLKVLQEIAKHLDVTLPNLFLRHPHQILANVFLLQGSVQTNNALTFIINHLVGESGSNKTIGVHNLISSCWVPLLVELVIILGSDDKVQKELVRVIFFA